MDKWFTDLAAHAGVDNVTVSYWPAHFDPVEVVLWISAGGGRFAGNGQTLNEAMTAALAKLRTSRALDTLGAIDGGLL